MISQAIRELFNNPAFWTFLGLVVTGYFGYKEAIKRSPAQKAKTVVKKASSFEELRAVVEVLQDELIKKDKRHKDDTEYILTQLRDARDEVRELAKKYGIVVKENLDLREVIAGLKDKMEKHELRLNKGHVGESGEPKP